MKKLTKKQVLENFKEIILPGIKKLESRAGYVDDIMRREAWNNYTDALCKSGEITENNYNNWNNPF